MAAPLSFAELAQLVSPAVVNINTSMLVAAGTGPQGIVPEGSPFEDFFNDGEGEGGQQRASAAGSGFVISPMVTSSPTTTSSRAPTRS